MTDEARCTGHCCRVIHVGVGASRREIEEIAIREGSREAWFIVDMLRPLVGDDPKGTGRWFTEADRRYTCRHFDGVNCTAYEERPDMCRNYPYGRPCPEDGCTLVQIGEAKAREA